MGKMITSSARSDDAREKIEKVEQSDKSNKQHDEVNTLTIMNGSSIAKANHASSEGIFHQEVNPKKSAGYSSENKKHEETNAERHMDAKQPSNNIHQTEYSSTAKPDKETNKELHLNGKLSNLSKEDMLESKAWDKETYKEYILETDNEQRSSCFIKAPAYVLEQLQCRLMDDISSLLVSESEELVSNVLGLWSKDPDLKIPFPLSISIPFNSRYRGNYKDVMVKANDEKLHASYLTPNSLDGYHGTHKGSFAEIKVYKLGIYAVVSCLRKENFTVPRKGLSVKLSMDSRISLNYPPGCFNTSVIVQFKVQPIDTSLISLLKVKHDIYHSVVSSSPLVHVKQPSIHRFHKNITVILPCPPNPEKKKQVEDTENKRASTATASRVAQAQQIRAVSASVRKPGDNPTELLKLIAFKEDQWIILDDVVVKNIQNGIVLFEVAEHLQSFTVIRLSSPMDNSHLLSFIQNLQDAIHSSMVNVVLYRRKDNPQKAVVQLIPSKELNWEVLNLRDAGYTGPPEPSEQIPLQEGEQIHLRFYGNISASDGKSLSKSFKLTFHSQRKQQLSLNLAVVDEFGNHSSPHYKGTVAIYKISKDDIMESYKRGIESEELLQQRAPLCKLALTLPKMEKNISRPSSTKLSSSEPTDIFWDNLLQWLAQELSEEDTSLLVLSLPIRRSTIQLVKLKSPDNLTEQIFELLTFWKKSLPTSADKLRLLARHLRKIGREDLVEGLQRKSEEKASMQT